MVFFAGKAARPRFFSSRKGSDPPHDAASATEPVLPCLQQESAVDSGSVGEARRFRKELVERMEKEISRKFQACDSCAAAVDGGAFTSEDSTCSGSSATCDAKDSKEVIPNPSHRQVQQVFCNLTHFVQDPQDPQDPSRSRSSSGASGESLDSALDSDDVGDDVCGDDNESGGEPSPDVVLPGPPGDRRRSCSAPAEASQSSPGAVGEQRRGRRSGSVDRMDDKPKAGFLSSLGLRSQEVGSRNKTQWRRRTIWNQCFYLSIAHAYVGTGDNERQTKRLARRLRYAIEAAVLQKHPAWSQGLRDSAAGTGPAMVFADFLLDAMQCKCVPKESNFLSRLAVCVVDCKNRHAEAYVGPLYRGLSTREEQEKNFILLLHVPGHYCCLVRDDDEGSKLNMTYNEFKDMLLQRDVFCVETLA